MAPSDRTSTGDIMLNINETNTASSGYIAEPEEDNTPQWKRIGDMVYFKNIDKAIPLRNIPKDMRKRMKL